MTMFDNNHSTLGMDSKGFNVDMDGDGILDGIGIDTDGDGILDTFNIDMNGDGILDAVGMDTNGDGILDTFNMDTNGDGIFDTIGMDTNGDGILDTFNMDRDGDGIIETIGTDTNGDGILDTFNIDTNRDGIFETVGIDTNGDGVFESFGMDSNGDGILDINIATSQDTMPNFDPQSMQGQDLVGNPANSMNNWHQQAHDDTCAVVSQEFVLEELTGQHFSEEQLRHEAMANGWYTDGGGTPLNDVGNLIEAHGFQVEKSTGNSIDGIEHALNSGEKVIVGVDGDEIWDHQDDAGGGSFSNLFGGSNDKDVNHAVEVIGIDKTDPNNPMVILNDPGHSEGAGMLVPEDEFLNAWEDSDNFMVNTINPNS